MTEVFSSSLPSDLKEFVFDVDHGTGTELMITFSSTWTTETVSITVRIIAARQRVVVPFTRPTPAGMFVQICVLGTSQV
jgi:hypothetical protein